MSSVTRPRGPLPSRVYWTRRILVLGLALALVFGIGRLLGGEPRRTAGPSARPAAASATSPSADLTASASATGDPSTAEPSTTQGRERVGERAEVVTPVAVPTGPCADSDVKVAPSVDGPAYAGTDVAITLNLTTVDSPACNWRVSPESVVVKLTSGDDRIWSTQDCPGAVPSQSVVVRKGEVTRVPVTWSGQRSDDECSRTTLWAEPGYYHAVAAALGAEPADQQFELLPPVRATITPTPTPTVRPAKAKTNNPKPADRRERPDEKRQ